MWMINQLGQDLHDAFEFHFPQMSPLKKWLHKRLTNHLVWGLSIRIQSFDGNIVVTERIVEYPVIYSWLPQGKSRILDIGCVSSRLPVQLASLGHEVHGLDVRPYRYTHCNLTFHQQDLFSWDPGIQFDVICLISVLEHMGLGGYGDLKNEKADYNAIQKIIGLLKPGGQFLVSVPFGKSGITSKHRIYDMAGLGYLFSNLVWRRSAYFKRFGKDWLPSKPEDLADTISPQGIVNGVAILDLVHPDVLS